MVIVVSLLDGLARSATIEVSVGNINDNGPVFTSTTFTMSITENLPAKSYVGRVTAVDDDGDNVFYLIQGGDTGENSFAI